MLYQNQGVTSYTKDSSWGRSRNFYFWGAIPISWLVVSGGRSSSSHQEVFFDGTTWTSALTTDRSLGQYYSMSTSLGDFWGSLSADDSASIVNTSNVPLMTTTVAQNETINITKDGSSGSSFYSSVVSSFKTFVKGVLVRGGTDSSSTSGDRSLLAVFDAPSAGTCSLLDTALAGLPTGTTLSARALQTMLDAGAFAGCLQPVADALAKNPINAWIESQVPPDPLACPGVSTGQTTNTPGQCGQGGANASSTALNPPSAGHAPAVPAVPAIPAGPAAPAIPAEPAVPGHNQS